MWKFNVLIYFFIVFNAFADDILLNEYNILYNDLLNFDTSGYKSSWNMDNNRGEEYFNLSQGALMQTGIDTNFAIIGDGFFKIRLENDKIGYTRYGDFNFTFGDSECEFTLRTRLYGYKLHDQIIIPNNTVNLKLENNILYAFLTDDTKLEIGQINVYEIDVEKLIRYKDSIFITLDNYDSQIKNDSRIITGFIEMSNVNVMETLMRMNMILWELKNYGYNFDNKMQIILMLINNVPILSELFNIRLELINIQEKLLTEDERVIIENISITLNEHEVILPIRINNSLYLRINILEIYRHDLLRSSIKFLRIE
jgi:flagellar basal body rod protein FlgG